MTAVIICFANFPRTNRQAHYGFNISPCPLWRYMADITPVEIIEFSIRYTNSGAQQVLSSIFIVRHYIFGRNEIVNLVLNASPNLPICSQVPDFELGIFICIITKLELTIGTNLKPLGCCAVINLPTHKLDIVADVILLGYWAKLFVVWPAAVNNYLKGNLITYFGNTRAHIVANA